jgi:transforming growth factor-beta-induced protein
MTRSLKILLAVALMLVAVTPVFAQDGEDDMQPTIADIVVESATAEEDAEFTALLAAVEAADPLVLDALADPEAELTVFAPTDAAFEALGEETLTAVLDDQELVTEILLFHVLDGAVFSEDVVAALEASEGAFTVPTLQGQNLDVTLDMEAEGGVTVDGAPLILELTDIEAANGVIHVIDAVMLPEDRTIAEIVVENATDMEAPQFTALLAAVEAADPIVLEALSTIEDETGEFVELTVFAPTDAAFEALGEETLAAVLGDSDLVTAILLYHVLEGVNSAQDAQTVLAEMDGEFLAETLLGEELLISTDMDGNLTVDGATVIITNIDAANGIIHVIDMVLEPMLDDMGEAEME